PSPSECPKTWASERAVGIRQRHHPDTMPRPDVERVLLHAPRTIRRRRDRQFSVAMREITLAGLEAIDLHLHRLSHSGERAIDADHRVTVSGDDLILGIRRRHACR